MYTVLTASLLFLTILAPSLAYLDGARIESCYNQSVESMAHESLSGLMNNSQECMDPCTYRLNVMGRVRSNDTLDTVPLLNSTHFLFSPNETYQFNLTHGANGYLGFLIQGRGVSVNEPDKFDEETSIYGTWDNGTYHRQLRCGTNINDDTDLSYNSVTHLSRDDLQDQHNTEGENLVIMEWTAPGEPPDTIIFWFTVVQQLRAHFLPIMGPTGILMSEPTTTPTPRPPTTPPETTTTPPGVTPPGLRLPEIIGIAVGAAIGGILILVVVIILIVIAVMLGKNKDKAKKSDAHYKLDEDKKENVNVYT